MGTRERSLLFLYSRQKSSSRIYNVVITVDRVNAEGWIICQIRSDTGRVGFLPDAATALVMVAHNMVMHTHNWKSG